MDLWAVHGILAVVAWMFFAPLGIIVSFLRNSIMNSTGSTGDSKVVWHRDFSPEGSQTWAKIHRIANETCFLLTLISFITAVVGISKSDKAHFRITKTHHHHHPLVGLIIMVLLPFLWVAGRLLMPPKHRNDNNTNSNPVEDNQNMINETLELLSKTESQSHASTYSHRPPQSKVVLLWVHRIFGAAMFICALWEIQSGIKIYFKVDGNKSVNYFLYSFYGWVGIMFVVAVVSKLREVYNLKKTPLERT